MGVGERSWKEWVSGRYALFCQWRLIQQEAFAAKAVRLLLSDLNALKFTVVIFRPRPMPALSSYAGSMLKTVRQMLRTGTSFRNCHSLTPDWPDASIEFLCRLNVEDREADIQDRYVLHKLPKALRPLVSMPTLSS